MRRSGYGALLAVLCGCAAGMAQTAGGIGSFTGASEVGTVLHAGSAQYDAAQKTYTVTGSGENIWAGTDAFHFVWTKMSGDVALGADITVLTSTGNPHRKAVLMIRQSLDADAVYADAALHGNGLTSLQYRDAQGGETHEIESAETGPARLRIEKRGDRVYLFVAQKAGDPLRPAGAAIQLPLSGEFYVGLGVCAHDKDASATAAFSHVDVKPLMATSGEPALWSVLETVPVASTDRHVTFVSPGHFEAPNWTPDGAALIFNWNGHLARLAVTSEVHPMAQGQPVAIDTGAQTHCNNDHVLSPDGKWIGLSDSSQADHQSSVYVVPIGGGTPRRVTTLSPSYLHGWSPDGKTLAFTGERNGNFDIYAIPVSGGIETRLTTAEGLDDGPEYSPDGQWIYFNSVRDGHGKIGHMQIWRMHADGSGQEQVVKDETNDWFPHISPDGKLMVFLAYGPEVTGHPANQDVELRLMTLADGKVKTIAKLFGGQGTINVPSWSPDSQKVAFVSYELLPADEAPEGCVNQGCVGSPAGGNAVPPSSMR
jgi:TolB protein